MSTPASERFSERANNVKGSAIREILKVTEHPDIISFAGGLPSPDAFPVKEIQEAFARVLTENAIAALQYSTTDGFLPLREWVANRVGTKDAPVSPDEVIIVSGSQQGLDLLGKALINEGEKVLVEAPTYLGALQAFTLFSPNYVSLASDEEGLIPETLDEKAEEARDSKFLYVQPNFQNPTGRLLSAARRHALVEKARKYDFLILEDDPYGALSYGGDHLPSLPSLPSLRSLASERTVYMGSFSKVLAPGIRLGYLVAPKALRDKLVLIKQATDLHTSTLSQRAVYEVVKNGFLDTHIPRVCALYKHQCEAMLKALEAHMPQSFTWNKPVGGMFLWAELPKGMDATLFLNDAVEKAKVAFVPGAPFYAGNPSKEALRLAFVTVPAEKIEKGIAALGHLLSER